MSCDAFLELGLNKWLASQCSSIGLKIPTAIQKNCIPRILSGMDCVGCAKTGSGKTLTFALPVLQKLCDEPYGIFALVITPTRELAYQIADQFAVVGKEIHLRTLVVTGGIDMIAQGLELAKNPHIVVATPGRLADHIESCNTFSLRRIRFLVLDEADRLLGNKFEKQIKTIFHALPKNKQTLLFSATMTNSLDIVNDITTKEVFVWKSQDEVKTVDDLSQYYVLCPLEARDGYLVETIRAFNKENEKSSIMVFTDTCKNCQLLSMTLNEVGIENVALHSMISQKQRLASLAKFKSNIIRILISTDVSSRGLDIPAVSLVINSTIPNNATDYIHRVGRTARAGNSGIAISLITPYDIKLLKSIEHKINTKLKEYKISDREVSKILTQVKVTMRESEITLDETDFEERKLINKRKRMIMEGKDPDELSDTIEKKKNKLKNKKRLKASVSRTSVI